MKNHQISQRTVAVFFLFVSLSTSARAQDQHMGSPVVQQNAFNNRTGEDVNYISGAAVNYNDVSNMNGSPFFVSEWTRGIVYFNNETSIDNGELQFNWVKNQLSI